MNTVPGFEIELERGGSYSVEIDGEVVAVFVAQVSRELGLAARGDSTAFVHEDGRPLARESPLSVRRLDDTFPHHPVGTVVTDPIEDVLAEAPEGRYHLACGTASFDLWLGPVVD